MFSNMTRYEPATFPYRRAMFCALPKPKWGRQIMNSLFTLGQLMIASISVNDDQQVSTTIATISLA